jgi:hypothetical protein
MASHNDTAGQLLNSLSTGVSITDAISEILDNSISAGSSKIHLNLSGSTLIISDNGCGMDRGKLEDSAWLNRRSSSSSQRHGRYGFGKKQAEITLTNLEGSVTTFSSSGGRISQITTNYPRILQTGVYAPQACGLECDSSHIWKANAIDPSGNGTISCICLSDVVRRKIAELCDDHTLNGLQFKLATTYCGALANGIKITIQCGESNIHEVYLFDRLCSSKRDTPAMHYKAYEIDILQPTAGEMASYYVKTADGVCQRFDQSKKKWADADAPASFDSDRIGSVTYEMAYSTDWHNLQKDDLKKNGITSLSDGQTGVEDQRINTDGRELVRNEKVIKHSRYKYKNVTNSEKKVHKQTRERISFKANDRMDDQVFKVQVNKSSVNESEIDEYFWKALEQLKDQFVKSTSSKLSSEVVEVQSSSAHSAISSPPSPPSPPPPSEQTFPSDTTKPKRIPARKVKTRVISDSDSENEPDNGRGAGVVAAIRVIRPVAVAVAGGGGPAIPTEMPNFVPDSECVVGSSTHQFINRNTGENILAEWKRSGKYMAALKERLDKMHIEFSGNLAANTLRRYLNRIPLDEKYDLLLELILEKYPSPETYMKGGIDLQRDYNNTFEADIAAGIAKGM